MKKLLYGSLFGLVCGMVGLSFLIGTYLPEYPPVKQKIERPRLVRQPLPSPSPTGLR